MTRLELAMVRRFLVTTATTLAVLAGPQGVSALEVSSLLMLKARQVTLVDLQVTRVDLPASLSPEERMQRRFPQPVKVGDLIGLPLLDDDDRTLGYVQSVARTPDGKIKLIVPYGGFLGWGRRPVAVPVEVVAIAARQLAALDMTRAELAAAPAWNDPQSRVLPPDDIIRIGLYRR
jgi:PRC-barrel domain protein